MFFLARSRFSITYKLSIIHVFDFSGIVSPESMRLSWTIVDKTQGKVRENWGYGLGWEILPEKHELGCCKEQHKTIVHTGKFTSCDNTMFYLQVYENYFDEISFSRCFHPH